FLSMVGCRAGSRGGAGADAIVEDPGESAVDAGGPESARLPAARDAPDYRGAGPPASARRHAALDAVLVVGALLALVRLGASSHLLLLSHRGRRRGRRGGHAGAHAVLVVVALLALVGLRAVAHLLLRGGQRLGGARGGRGRLGEGDAGSGKKCDQGERF